MTRILYPTVRYDATLKDGMVTCTQGDKSIDVVLGRSELTEEDLEEIKNDPTMQQNVTMRCGGMTKAKVTMPLWKYFTGWEKRAIKRAIYLFNSGDLAQLAVENDGVTNLNKILKNIHEKALKMPREKRTTRHGVSYRPSVNVNQGNQPGYAGTMERKKI